MLCAYRTAFCVHVTLVLLAFFTDSTHVPMTSAPHGDARLPFHSVLTRDGGRARRGTAVHVLVIAPPTRRRRRPPFLQRQRRRLGSPTCVPLADSLLVAVRVRLLPKKVLRGRKKNRQVRLDLRTRNASCVVVESKVPLVELVEQPKSEALTFA